ncbi:MAG TPA: AmmeMemoRadiSam system protein A [Blastocatellia bacterium]|nr:AmmeMemoRadiSam system protein A [Blastocatellia bacterium]
MQRPPNNISLPELARLAVEKFVMHGETLEPPLDVQGTLSESAGVFVTLRTMDGQLRGCIGTIEPARSTVAEEVIQNAISAATRDSRFAPVARHELAGLRYGVDVLERPEPARGPEDLDAARYGVIIETLDGSRRGLLLPRIEGIETVEDQWQAVHLKAGIPPGVPVRVERFTVARFGKD